MKISLFLLVCLSAAAQGWGRREAMQPWLHGRFDDAEQQFTRMRNILPPTPWLFLWEADFEIERGRFAMAAALIRAARKYGMSDRIEASDRRSARLLLSTGRFAEAQRIALDGRPWDRKSRNELKSASAMSLVTLGEIALSRGDYDTALVVLERARDRAKSASALEGVEWVRAQNDIAVVQLARGSTQTASEVAAFTLSSAEREWGVSSIPAIDALDVLGMVQVAQADFKHAESSLTLSRSWREALYRTDHPKVAESYIHAALLSAARGQMSEAIRLIQRSLEMEQSLAGGSGGRVAMALLTGAEIYVKAEQVEEARDCYARSIQVLEGELGADAPRLSTARKHSAALLAR